MNRKFFLSLTISVFFLVRLAAGGIGAGATASYDREFCPFAGGRLDYAADTIPFVFTADLYFSDYKVESALGGIEFLAGNIHLFKAVNFYYAPELCAGYDFLEDEVILENAFYIGLNGFCTSHLQLFVQGGWAPQLLFTTDSLKLELVNFSLRAGIIVWNK